MKLLLSDTTRRQLQVVRQQPGGSYLFIGRRGVGKFSAAYGIAKLLCKQEADIFTLKPTKRSIGIDEILELQHKLQLRSTSRFRFAIIKAADRLTREAQNAFLKLLEEPPLDTTIILTVTQTTTLAPTILSRCKKIIFPLQPAQAIAGFLSQQHKAPVAEAAKISQLANGAVGAAVELYEQPERREKYERIRELALRIIELPLYKKLAISTSSKQKYEPEAVVLEVAHILERQMYETSEPARLAQRLGAAERLLRYVQANGNPKFALDILALELAK